MRRASEICLSVALAAFAACAFLFFGGYSPARLARGVYIEGEDFSRMPVYAAQRRLRGKLAAELEGRSFTLRAGEYSCTVRPPELHYKSNVSVILRRARERGGEYRIERALCVSRLEERVSALCAEAYRASRPARIRFSPGADEPFSFSREVCGRYADGAALLAEAERALAAGESEARTEVFCGRPAFTEEKARESCTLLASFTTRYSEGSANRAANIARAAQKLDGVTLAAGEEFSFNTAVGARTAANGFLPAPVILNGEFVAGTGGGVCQVSTTLYNAALLSGLTVTEQHPHSLAVGYVEPSFDAMVSECCDLRFSNGTGSKVYLTARAVGGALTVRVYGQKSPVSYSRRSVVLGSIPPPDPEVREGEEELVLRAERAGLRSEGYLVRSEGGKQTSVRIRRDSYAPIRGILQKIPAENAEENAFQPLSLVVKYAKIGMPNLSEESARAFPPRA